MLVSTIVGVVVVVELALAMVVVVVMVVGVLAPSMVVTIDSNGGIDVANKKSASVAAACSSAAATADCGSKCTAKRRLCSGAV